MRVDVSAADVAGHVIVVVVGLETASVADGLEAVNDKPAASPALTDLEETRKENKMPMVASSNRKWMTPSMQRRRTMESLRTLNQQKNTQHKMVPPISLNSLMLQMVRDLFEMLDCTIS